MRSTAAAAVLAAAAAAGNTGQGQGPPPAAYVYSGPGAGTRSVLSTLHSLREALVPAVQVASLDAAELLAGGWQAGCLLLVMPGGADLPYCQHLNGRGNALIREYVDGGGAYLGLCAGAYYACARVEFEPGSRLEVVGDRELRFFPGTAAGSIYPGFCYESEDGAVAAPLRFRCLEGRDGIAGCSSSSSSSSSGGGGRRSRGSGGGELPQQQKQHQQDRGMACSGAVESAGDQAEWAPLSVAEADWQEGVDYVNGGPGFWLPGDPAAPQAAAAGAAGSDGRSAAPRDQQQGQAPPAPAKERTQQQRWEPWERQGAHVLATYPEHGGAAAALLCRVGSRGGRAVLCGSHPELHPSWLNGSGPPLGSSSGNGSGSLLAPAGAVPVAAAGTAIAGSSTAAPFVDSVSNRAAASSALAADLTGSAGHMQRLQQALMAGQPRRWRLWRSLLVAAGLQPWMQPYRH